MPWEGKQKRAAQLALAARRGKVPVSELKGAALSMYRGMTDAQLFEAVGRSTKDPFDRRRHRRKRRSAG